MRVCNNPACNAVVGFRHYRPYNYSAPKPICCSMECAVAMAAIKESEREQSGAALCLHRAVAQPVHAPAAKESVEAGPVGRLRYFDGHTDRSIKIRAV